ARSAANPQPRSRRTVPDSAVFGSSPPGLQASSQPAWRRRYPRVVGTLGRVSSLATAPRRATTEPTGETPTTRIRGVGVTVDAVLGAFLTAGFGLVVFVATGGTALGPNTWVQIALLVIGVGCATALVLRRASAPTAHAATTVALFAALAVLSYLSITWSVQPATSWLEADRTLSYLAAFGAAV